MEVWLRTEVTKRFLLLVAMRCRFHEKGRPWQSVQLRLVVRIDAGRPENERQYRLSNGRLVEKVLRM